MLQCPHCLTKLQATEIQQEKIKQALNDLAGSNALKINCPVCKEPIHLEQTEHLRNGGGSSPGETARPTATTVTQAVPWSPKPAPPDLSWLQARENVSENEVLGDARLAMVLMEAGEGRELVAKALEGLGYGLELPVSAEVAKEKMRSVDFAAVVFSPSFEGSELANSKFHLHMSKLPMANRRLLLYVLVGPDFHTLYDLEALTHSANLVVNEKDLGQMPLILKKALKDHQTLFGPYLEGLLVHRGKL